MQAKSEQPDITLNQVQQIYVSVKVVSDYILTRVWSVFVISDNVLVAL